MNRKKMAESCTVVEDGFQLEVTPLMESFLYEQGLRYQGVLHLANGLAAAANEEDNWTSPVETQSTGVCLYSLISSYDGKLYSFIMEAYGPEAITPKLWMEFSRDLSWPLRAQVFKDMPTGVIEQIGNSIWQIYFYSVRGAEGTLPEVLKQLGQRDDIYGLNSLPSELSFGLLLDEELQNDEPPLG